MVVESETDTSLLDGVCACKRSRHATTGAMLWTLLLDDPAIDLDRLSDLLGDEERVRATRFLRGDDVRRFVVSRAALRKILADALKDEPRTIAFDAGPHGKPQLVRQDDASDIRFNLAHSGNRALIAVTRDVEIGVDIEHLLPDRANMDVARRHFSQAEATALEAMAPSEQPAAFFRIWTRKEALVKAMGGGLSIPLDAFDVSAAPDVPQALLASRLADGDPARWWLTDTTAEPDYVAALCVARPPVNSL